jgi:hypothetical protein
MRSNVFKPRALRREVGEHPWMTRWSSRPCRERPELPAVSAVWVERLELGVGCAVFIRGEGEGLSWDRGERLIRMGSGAWAWSGRLTRPVRFQLLLDDVVWERGEPRILEPGQTAQFTPDFEWPDIPRTARTSSHDFPADREPVWTRLRRGCSKENAC